MRLTEIGESRVRGYLFVLGRSLRSFLPAEVAEDAVREVESHIRERIAQVEPREAQRSDHAEAAHTNAAAAKADERREPLDGREKARSRAEAAQADAGAAKADERAVVERILSELGPPLRVAQAYSQEMTLDEAVATGRFVPMLRALWHLATTSVVGFAWAMVVFVGWTVGVAFLLLALTKIVLPNNVGIFYLNGQFHSAGANLMLPPGIESHPFGYWIVPVAVAIGLLVLIATQRGSRRILAWMRSRRPSARLRFAVEVRDR